jgi:hypothetical protein
MANPAPTYRCPICDGANAPWHLYPALGRPLCDDCDADLLDDHAVLDAACRVFSVTPTLLAEIVERQRPVILSTAEVARRFT